MAGLNDWMGPTQVLGPRERQALIEAGVMTREDFMDKSAPSTTPVQPPVGGSSAQEDLAKSLGLTVPQLIARQSAQRDLLLKKRKAAGYAGGGMIGALGRIARKLGSEAAPVRRGVTDIIKERGGQWLSGSVENALRSELHNVDEPALANALRVAGTPDRTMDNARALDGWIKGPLTKHIKSDMGTANDPFVRLADQGIMVNETPYTPSAGGPLKIKRSRQGYNPYGDAKTEAGKAWENTNDTLVTQQSAADFRKLPYMLEENPWLATLADDTPVHSIGEDALYEGGISHLLDELGNAIDPDSGLPAHLQIHPDQLRSGNFSVDAAIRRVNDINKWRADATTAANQAKAINPATHLHKDYGDGFKWVQLKKPEGKVELGSSIGVDETSPGNFKSYTLDKNDGHKKYSPPFSSYEEAMADAQTKAQKAILQDALKYEGDTMGHCVGGYCDDVANGRSQIYSLRDVKGQPHVTVEAKPGSETSFWDLPDDRANQYYARAAEEIRQQRGLARIPKDVQTNDKHDALHDAILGHANSLYEAEIPENMLPVIAQVKGKGNKKPIDDYLPYVQDFVKSGQWSDVGDLQNTGLSHRSRFPSLTDGPEYLTPDEVAAARVKLGLDPAADAGYAQGGMIPMRDRKAELRSAELAKLRAPELKASPTLPQWMSDIGRGLGAAMTEGFPHAIGNMYNELKGLPTVPSAYKQQPGVFQDEIENSWAKAIPENLLDPSNLVGFEAAKPVAKALPALLAVGATGYSPEAEASKLGALGRIARRLAGPAERGATIVRDVPLHAPGPAVSAKSYEASDLGALMDALAPYVKPGMLKKQDGDSIFGQAIENISDPDGPADALTTVLFGADGTPQAYHQVSPKGGAMSEADYLAFLGSISGQHGAGEQALRHSLDNSSGEMSLYPTPGAQKFYDKMATRIPGIRKVQGDGNNVDSMAWSRKNKAQGGVVDYNDLHGY